MPTGRRGLKTTNTGLSIEEKLLDRAKDRARRRNQSFSAYVSTLLEDDEQREKQKPPASLEERVRDLERQVAEAKPGYGKDKG